MADFASTLMILRATTVLGPDMGALKAARVATLLYTVRKSFIGLSLSRRRSEPLVFEVPISGRRGMPSRW